jgi:hypothetical protein
MRDGQRRSVPRTPESRMQKDWVPTTGPSTKAGGTAESESAQNRKFAKFEKVITGMVPSIIAFQRQTRQSCKGV